ncbi:MAG: UDP-N-acetylmuramoyl-tripeptide--D-alanyl-D-alanine ligase, partial [Candidatus Geothermincolia bacterium]
MITLELPLIVAATRGKLLAGEINARSLIRAVSTDTRSLKGGELFVALRGERHDAHDFLEAALRAGAGALMVERLPQGLARKVPREVPVIGVADTTQALAAMAGAVRDKSGAHVVGITGSAGKTITKDLTAAILRRRYRTVASHLSFNNEVGVPLTLLQLRPATEVVVLEMGSRGAGDIARLAQYARPDVGVITNIGPAHFGRFGSLAATARAKAELLQALPASGTAVINSDDAGSALLQGLGAAKVMGFGTSAGARVRASGISVDQRCRPSFTLAYRKERVRVSLPLAGRHNVSNALAAAAAAIALGTPLADVKLGLERARLTEWRMQMLKTPLGVNVINDSYNANPASMRAALECLRD